VIIARQLTIAHERVIVASMRTTEHNPTRGVYAATPDYIHALEVEAPARFLFASGTMGLDPAGAPGTGLARQLELIWANLRAILAHAGMGVDDIVRVRSYLGDAAYAEANAAARMAALGGRRVATTSVVAGTLEREWLVEIEIVAAV
jgi:2-iminobutanoate/2-iminopropanoate deaminase